MINSDIINDNQVNYGAYSNNGPINAQLLPEIIGNVFSHLNPLDLQSVASVCHFWKGLAINTTQERQFHSIHSFLFFVAENLKGERHSALREAFLNLGMLKSPFSLKTLVSIKSSSLELKREAEHLLRELSLEELSDLKFNVIPRFHFFEDIFLRVETFVSMKMTFAMEDKEQQNTALRGLIVKAVKDGYADICLEIIKFCPDVQQRITFYSMMSNTFLDEELFDDAIKMASVIGEERCETNPYDNFYLLRESAQLTKIAIVLAEKGYIEKASEVDNLMDSVHSTVISQASSTPALTNFMVRGTLLDNRTTVTEKIAEARKKLEYVEDEDVESQEERVFEAEMIAISDEEVDNADDENCPSCCKMFSVALLVAGMAVSVILNLG